MNKIVFLLISLLFGIKSFSQGSCSTSVPWTEECIFYPNPYPSNVTYCYSFSGVDSAEFEFFRAAEVGTCLDIQETYTLYDSYCNIIEQNTTGQFLNLNLDSSYVVCYTVNCPTNGGIVLMCSSEMLTLPIDLLYFEGIKFYGGVKFVWATGYELNNSNFLLWTSQDMENWNIIGRIDGVGDSRITTEYSFIWNRPKDGVNYFRLDQIDNNGEITSYDIIAINFNNTEIENRLKGYNYLGQKIISE